MVGICDARAQVPSPPKIQLMCGTYKTVVEMLAERYNEQQAVLLPMSDGSMIVVFGNTQVGSWTLVKRMPNVNQACIFSVGRGFELLYHEQPS